MTAEASDRAKADDARVVDVVQRKGGLLKPQQYAFVVDVSLSDGSHTQIWRSYQEFFHFQCDLLAAFPDEASEKHPESRTIPFLPGKKLMSRGTKRLAESRRQGIDSYVQALLRLTTKIVDSNLVQQFFHRKATDPVRMGEKEIGQTLQARGTVAVRQGDSTPESAGQELEGSSRKTEVNCSQQRDSSKAPVSGDTAGRGDHSQSKSSTNGDSERALEVNKTDDDMGNEMLEDRGKTKEELDDETDDPVNQ